MSPPQLGHSSAPPNHAISLSKAIRRVSCGRGLSLESLPPVACPPGVVSSRLLTFPMASAVTVGLSL
jgi:hypothetical protein